MCDGGARGHSVTSAPVRIEGNLPAYDALKLSVGRRSWAPFLTRPRRDEVAALQQDTIGRRSGGIPPGIASITIPSGIGRNAATRGEEVLSNRLGASHRLKLRRAYIFFAGRTVLLMGDVLQLLKRRAPRIGDDVAPQGRRSS